MQATHYRSPAPCGDHFHVPVRAGDRMLETLIDSEDAARLGGRCLSLGGHGYVQMSADSRVQLLHRWIFGVTGRGYSVLVDHKDRNRLDNRRSNLRLVDGSVSNANRPQADAAVCAYRLPSGRWEAKYRWRRQRIHLGVFATREEAVEAVRLHRLAHHPDSVAQPLVMSALGVLQ